MDKRRNEAWRMSYILFLVMMALKFDGQGEFAATPVWAVLLVSMAPVVASILTDAVMLTLARLAYFFGSR